MRIATTVVALMILLFRRFAVYGKGKTYRCPTCKECWPDDERFTKCPACKVVCWKKDASDADDVYSLQEGLSLKSECDFEDFYTEKVSKEHLADIDELNSREVIYVGDIVNFG